VGKSQDLYNKAKKLIPGGTQLLSKRPEMFLPDFWPAYYSKAKGCEVWDLDNNKYLDMSHMGIGACILGYADPDVDQAVKQAVDQGSMATLNCPEEVELAELLCEIHPWAEMVRYARTGGEAMTVAVRIARAKSGKDLILFCGYHGWHDWYLATNLAPDKALDGQHLPGLEPKGVPRGLEGTTLTFNYNDLAVFKKLIADNRGRIAAVVMEPIRNFEPKDNFLQTIREITKKEKISLIFDEISSGWRLNLGGVHLKFGVMPDMAILAKAMSNGYPMAAIIGKGEVMQAAQESFISSTYWTERLGPTAALACIRKMKKNNVSDHLVNIGSRMQEIWKQLAKKHSLKIHVGGIAPMGHFTFDYPDGLVMKTLFTQLMLAEGILAANSFYASYAHNDNQIKTYFAKADKAFAFIAAAIKAGNVAKHLKGPVCHEGFKRLA